VGSGPGIVVGLPPTRTWLVTSDESWLVQLQEDRFYANWRRRGAAEYYSGAAEYPGFGRQAGVMDFALNEFSKLQAFCARLHDGEQPSALSVELSKIDLLVQGKHWTDVSDLARILPSVGGVVSAMGKASADVNVRWQEDAAGGTLAVSIVPARLKADPNVAVMRVEFRFAGAVVEDSRAQLMAASTLLNDAFERLVPDPERTRRFS
jgi:hypothetical protein